MLRSEYDDAAELSELSNEVEQLEKLAAKMKSALGGQMTDTKQRRPKRGRKQADKMKRLKGRGGGDGAVTLCQLMNICDSVALGQKLQ